jgi:uncharacterized protein YjiS (DUF1127 family)
MQLTVKDLYLELEALKKRVEVLESLIIEEESSEEEMEAINEYERKREAGELELLSFDDALKELGIDEAEIRKELYKGVKKA